MQNENDMFPGDDPPLVSDSERESFARSFHAATDPTSVFAHLAHGDVTPEEADALKVTHPDLFAEAGDKLKAEAFEQAHKGKPLDYEQRSTLGVLFGERTDATLGYDVLSAVDNARAAQGQADAQGAAPPPAAPGGGRHRGGGGKSLKGAGGMAPRFQTTFEAVASRGKKGGYI